MTTKAKKETLSVTLVRLGACDEAQEWAKGKSLDRAWKICKRSDWMIWLLARTVIREDDSRFRLMACDFAEAVLHLVPKGEDRPRKAIEAVRAFLAGTSTRESMAAAGAAAGAAARAAAWTTAGAAAWAAARAAAWDAAWDAAGAAAWDAAGAAAWDAAWDAARDAARAAAWTTAGDAARDAAGAAQCKIIRKHFPTCPKIKR